MANNSVSFRTAKDSSLDSTNCSFYTAKNSSVASNKSNASEKDSCCCSSDGKSGKSALKTPIGNITLPPIDKTKLPFDVLMRKLQRKMVRRDAPKGENLEGILRVLGTVEGQDITVQEFIGLISPYTGDSGEVLRHVLNDDIMAFKKMAKKVFETITQDNSDVLLNQQLSIGEYYSDRTRLLQRQMMEAIEEIYDMAPTFDFERYYAEKDKYLEELFTLPTGAPSNEPDEEEMTKRQQAYHHLQWLRSEGERLTAENEAMRDFYNNAKLGAQDDNCRAWDMQEDAEAQRLDLEMVEQQKMAELQELNDELEGTIISREQRLRERADKGVHNPASIVPADASRPRDLQATTALVGGSYPKMKKRREWKETTAKSLDLAAMAHSNANARSRISGLNSTSISS